MTTRTRLFPALPIALVATLALAGGVAAPASAAKKVKAPSYVAAANGVVGVSSVIRVSAPRYAGRTVTIAASQPGSATVTLPVALDSSGSGAVAWAPSAAGSWAIQGQGPFAVATGSTVSVAAVPTQSTITVAAQGQVSTPMDVFATVEAVDGSLAPQGSVTFATTTGTNLGTAPLVAGAGASSTARISWTPPSVGLFPLIATYNPAPGTAGAANALASSATQSVFVVQGQPLLTIRVPSTLRVGQAANVAGVVNNLSLQGSVAMSSDANGTNTSVIGSTTLQGGVAEGTWIPSISGPQIITADFSSTNTNVSASQTQPVTVLGPKPADAFSVGPAGQGAWPVGTNISLPAGANVSITAGTQSGGPVTMATTGSCLVINTTLFTTTNSGACTLVVSSTGSAQYAQTDATYAFTIQRAR